MTFWVLVGLMTVVALAFVMLPIVRPVAGRKPWLVMALLIGLPLAAILVYQRIGTPEAAIQALSGPSGDLPDGHPSQAMSADLLKMADKLAEKLKANPDNAEGWVLLAHTYAATQHYQESLMAFDKASALLPNDPQLLADYADAMAMSNRGFDPKSEALVDRALAIDPGHVKALMLKGAIAFNRKDYAQAIAVWEKLLKTPGLDAEAAKETSGGIAEARRRMGAGK
ncbi:formate-dependent nitrite reductase complex subunit NrfG [mine drainage metagenome]|uniref:Formate-dependent nitrite reductase complex subunit NrfG n=1 Tax=mine drainage metagenome TaxID=410659 RepID=A0A1J5QV57_9ZZZZ